MKVLIVGSTHNEVTASMRDLFITACRQIGAAFARAKIEIVIGSDSPNSADRYVLEGAASIEGRHKVWILRPDLGETPFAAEIARFGERIDAIHKRLRGSWSAGRVPQILAADAVLLIGGAGGTLTSGYVAPALERPVLAIAAFGGAAAELWPHLEPYYHRLGEISDRVSNLREQWKPENAELAVHALNELLKRRTFKQTPRLPLGIYLLMLFSCLGAWIYLFASPLHPMSYSFFAILLLAGLLGTMLRNNLRLVFDPTASFSWNELLIEVGAGMLLSFALCLLYLVGAITITGKTEPVLLPDSDAAFQRVSVVMTLLGLGGGLMIEQAAHRVRGWFTDQFPTSPD